jgi:membrane protein DedA with SNARE-associated domain
MSELIAWMSRVPDVLVYAALGVGAALENIVPAVPADTFVALGGFLSEVGSLDARWVFATTWLCNVGTAMVTYRLGYVHGRSFFEKGWGRHVLKPHQMERMSDFYDRWGTQAIFLTRFLPGIRAVVPIFAGVTHHGWLLVAAPMAVASAIWYGGLVWLGILVGENLELLTSLLGRVNVVLASIAVLVAGGMLWWWWRTRRAEHE